jgi:hypothetical protein
MDMTLSLFDSVLTFTTGELRLWGLVKWEEGLPNVCKPPLDKLDDGAAKGRNWSLITFLPKKS